jgi:chromosome segregation ATPase
MDNQNEDYKVLQAMRTEISGLVESKNRLDLEIQELQRVKAQCELETSMAQAKLSDVGGEWQKRMDALIGKETEIRNGEVMLTIQRQEFEKEKKDKQISLDYAIEQAKTILAQNQQKEAEIAKTKAELNTKEARLGNERADIEKKLREIEEKRAALVSLEQSLDKHSRELSEADKLIKAREFELNNEATRIRALEGQISQTNSKAREEAINKQRELMARASMLDDRERELEKQKATMDTRITKNEAEAIRNIQSSIEKQRQELAIEKTQFELAQQKNNQVLHDFNEQIELKKKELSLIIDKIEDIERREKGVADSEAGLAAKEKQLMFEIAKFKKRVVDAKMEEAINESR